MKRQIQVTELSHDELVNLFSTAFYSNDAYMVDYDADKYQDIIKDQECFEDKLAEIVLNGGEILITDMYADDADEVHNGKNVKVTTETITRCNWLVDEEYELPTYHVTLKDIYNGLSKEEASSYVQELFIDEEGDMITADCLMQLVCYGEIIYG